MSQPDNNQQSGCSEKCRCCNMKDTHEPGAYSGWRLTAASLVMFINPVGMAIGGAILLPMLWASEHAMFAGAAAGLAIGFVESTIIGIIIRKNGKTEDECNNN